MFPATLSTATLEERIRHHLETLEAAPGDKEAFKALEALYQKHARFEELLRLYEERARLIPEPGAAPELLEKAAELARQKLRDPARAEALYRQVLDAAPRHAGALRAVAELRLARGGAHVDDGVLGLCEQVCGSLQQQLAQVESVDRVTLPEPCCSRV